MKKNFELPLFLMIFFIIGVIGSLLFNTLINNNFKRNEIRQVFESCEKTGFYFYENKMIKCEIKE